VGVDNQPGSTPDKTVILVDVEEQPTGDLTFGAGFSSSVGPVGSVGIRERNLLGRGQDLRLSVTLAGEESQFDVGFTEPYFLGRNLAAGFDLFRIDSDQDERSFDLSRTGGSLRAGYSPTENLRHILRYTLEERDISNVQSDASRLVRDEEGTFLESSVSQEFIYDTRDTRFDPSEGYVVRLRNKVAGLGGDVRFVKSSVGGAYHYPFLEDWTATVRGEVGNIVGLGEDTRISDRHFIGGSNLRGFEFAGVGPRDRLNGDAVGANNFYTSTLEVSFPLGLPEEFDIRGRMFTDVGSAWEVDGNTVDVDDENTPRVSVGAGISWNSPFGPVVVDLGFAVVEEEFDETELLNFSFGTQF
jgi:outer membrane protein insertion porin family